MSEFKFSYSGKLYGISKYISYNTHLSLSKLNYKGEKVQFYLKPYATYTGSPMDVIISDDLLLYLGKNSNNIVKLPDDDYYFSYIMFPNLYNGNNNRIDDNKYKVELYVRYAGDATSGTISKLNTDVIYYYVRKTPNVDSTISKTGTNEINKRTNEVDYQITYTPTVKDFNGSASITITDTLPYGIDTSKSNLDGGTYDSSKHTITWTKNVNVITQEYSETITHNISVYYTGIPAKIRKITNKVSGSVTADSQTSTKETTKDTNINEPFKLIVKYLEYGTNKVLSNELSFTVYGGDAYETHSASDIPADYDLKIKPTNYKGTIQNEVTTVIWYYERRNPNIDSTISKTGTDEITHSNDVVSYEITYKPTIKDYVGNGNVKIIDTLPYHIDLDLSDLNGGTYNDEDKTITWTDTWNITNVSGENKEYKYNISVVYTDIDLTKDTMNNVVNGSIKLENGESNKETTHITNINVKGTIIVHYIDIETNEELCEQIETTDKVGNTYVPFLKNLKAMI